MAAENPSSNPDRPDPNGSPDGGIPLPGGGSLNPDSPDVLPTASPNAKDPIARTYGTPTSKNGPTFSEDPTGAARAPQSGSPDEKTGDMVDPRTRGTGRTLEEVVFDERARVEAAHAKALNDDPGDGSDVGKSKYDRIWGGIGPEETENRNRQYERHHRHEYELTEDARELTADTLLITGKDPYARVYERLDGDITHPLDVSEKGVGMRNNLDAFDHSILGGIADAGQAVDDALARGEITPDEHRAQRAQVEAMARDEISDDVRQLTGHDDTERFYGNRKDGYVENVTAYNASVALANGAIENREGFAYYADGRAAADIDAAFDSGAITAETHTQMRADVDRQAALAQKALDMTSGDDMTSKEEDHRRIHDNHLLTNAIVRGEIPGQVVRTYQETLDGIQRSSEAIVDPSVDRDAVVKGMRMAEVEDALRHNFVPPIGDDPENPYALDYNDQTGQWEANAVRARREEQDRAREEERRAYSSAGRRSSDTTVTNSAGDSGRPHADEPSDRGGNEGRTRDSGGNIVPPRITPPESSSGEGASEGDDGLARYVAALEKTIVREKMKALPQDWKPEDLERLKNEAREDTLFVVQTMVGNHKLTHGEMVDALQDAGISRNGIVDRLDAMNVPGFKGMNLAYSADVQLFMDYMREFGADDARTLEARARLDRDMKDK